MDFLGETAKQDFKAGDSSFLADTAKGQKVPAFEPSDIPGFLHPVVDGTPDTSQYVTSSDAEQSTTSGLPPKAIPRELAMQQVAKNDGIQNPSDKESEAALAKKKKGKPEAPKVETAFDYPL